MDVDDLDKMVFDVSKMMDNTTSLLNSIANFKSTNQIIDGDGIAREIFATSLRNITAENVDSLVFHAQRNAKICINNARRSDMVLKIDDMIRSSKQFKVGCCVDGIDDILNQLVYAIGGINPDHVGGEQFKYILFIKRKGDNSLVDFIFFQITIDLPVQSFFGFLFGRESSRKAKIIYQYNELLLM